MKALAKTLGLNALAGFGAAFLVVLATLAGDHGIIATARATEAENLAIPLPRPRPQIRILKPRTGSFPGRTQVMEFESAPFPYDGKNPVTGKPFFDVFFDGRFGKRGARGHVYWENESYTDSRVLLSIPRGFDIRKPAVMVVFFHGHGAKIDRDVRDRQQVAAQITRSVANAVVVAPQFAVDAADSSPGAFWDEGFFDEFLSEAGETFRWKTESQIITDSTPKGQGIGVIDPAILKAEVDAYTAAGVFKTAPKIDTMYDANLAKNLYGADGKLKWPF